VQTLGWGVPIENKEAIAKEAAERGKALQQVTEQIEALGGMQLGKVTPRAVEGWLVALRARGLAESTVRIAYDILLAILETAVRDGGLGQIRWQP
jgi:hypothetical protein